MAYEMIYSQEHCSGCLRCRLACSRAYAGAFQPSAARIDIDMSKPVYRARFSDTCNACGICADNCLFGALIRRKKEA